MIRIGACEGPIADILERVEQSTSRDDVDPRLLSLCRLDGVDRQRQWAVLTVLMSDAQHSSPHRCGNDEPRARARGGGRCDASQGGRYGSLSGVKLVESICDKRIASSGA